MGGYDGYTLRSGPASKYRIGLNIIHTGKIGVKGLFLEYGEYSPTPSFKPLSWVRISRGVFAGYFGLTVVKYSYCVCVSVRGGGLMCAFIYSLLENKIWTRRSVCLNWMTLLPINVGFVRYWKV